LNIPFITDKSPKRGLQVTKGQHNYKSKTEVIPPPEGENSASRPTQ